MTATRMTPSRRWCAVGLAAILLVAAPVALRSLPAEEASVAYATERQQFGKPIASFQLVQDMIAGISLDADAARLLVWRCADLIDRGEPFGTAASKAKLFASEAAVRAANNAIQVHGGAGYVDDFPVAKYLRDARVMTLYEGTSQVQKLLIGRAETGVSAF